MRKSKVIKKVKNSRAYQNLLKKIKNPNYKPKQKKRKRR